MAAKPQAGIELRGQEEDLVALALQIMTKLDLKAGHEAAWRAQQRREVGPSRVDFEDIAREMHQFVRQAYHQFHGVPPSERQKSRKADTPYTDDQLVEREGLKLIGHIQAYMDGQQLGE